MKIPVCRACNKMFLEPEPGQDLEHEDKSPGSCIICKGLKRNIVWKNREHSDQLTELRILVDRCLESLHGRINNSTRFSIDDLEQISKLTRCSSDITTAMAKIKKLRLDGFESMTEDKKLKVLRNFVMTLNPRKRAHFIESCREGLKYEKSSNR